MEIIWILLILLIGYYLFHQYSKKDDREIEILEKQADHFLKVANDGSKAKLERLKKELEEDKRKYDTDTHRDLIKATEDEVQSYKDWELKYIALKEKLKYAPVKERLALAQDWHDLTEYMFTSVLDLQHHLEHLDYYALASKEERVEENRFREKEGVQIREIIKRLEKKLKENHA